MSAIVIGSNGYIGRNIVYYLKTVVKEDHLVCADIHDSSVDGGLIYHKIDITDLNDLNKLDLDVDYIYMFSGLTGTWDGFENYDKFIAINETGLLNLLTAYRKQASKARIIFPSTRLVYKGERKQPLKEEDEKDPKTIYALNKVMCESILKIYHEVFAVNYTVFRICVPYGHLCPGAGSYGTIDFFLSKARDKQHITLYGDGEAFRTFTHVEDICSKVVAAVQKDESNGQIYNIGGENRSLLDVANAIALKYGVRLEHIPWPDNALKIESGDTLFDASKLERLTSPIYRHSIDNWLI